MNYRSQSTMFKLRKILRYVKLYGPGRTYAKVRSEWHMRASIGARPRRQGAPTDHQTVAIVGCGNYSYSTIAHYLRKRYGSVVRMCMDSKLDRAISLGNYYNVPFVTTDAADIFGDEKVRLVYIASNHATHAEYAIAALSRGMNVYIEKPHVVNFGQLTRLVQAMEGSKGRVFLGFNRPCSRFGRLIQTELAQEEGPGMYNWFVAGHDIDPDHWYFNPEEGGRALGNMCHWTDFILSLVAVGERYPILINASGIAQDDSNNVVTFTFADGTIGVISFSAKRHLFEGVRERFSAHRGNRLIFMDDFQTLRVDCGSTTKRYLNWSRDQGHKANICAAYESVHQDKPYDQASSIAYVANTGSLFLKTHEALETGRPVMVEALLVQTPKEIVLAR